MQATRQGADSAFNVGFSVAGLLYYVPRRPDLGRHSGLLSGSNPVPGGSSAVSRNVAPGAPGRRPVRFSARSRAAVPARGRTGSGDRRYAGGRDDGRSARLNSLRFTFRSTSTRAFDVSGSAAHHAAARAAASAVALAVTVRLRRIALVMSAVCGGRA